MANKIIFERICQPLHSYTFRAPKIRRWVEQHCVGKTLNLFAGTVKLAVDEVRVDADVTTNPDYDMDCLEFVRYATKQQWQYDTVIIDPPYSYRKSMEKYKGHIASPFKQLKDELLNIVPIGGRILTFGYHSLSMGKIRGFEVTNILLINHGGAQHDTICVVEKRIK
jgi:hypothetical protein